MADVMLPSIQTTKKGQATMADNNVIEFIDRETHRVALSEMLKTGTKHLTHKAVQAEKQYLFS